MFLDASAVIAILMGESDAAALAARLGQARKIYFSPIALYEAVAGLARAGNFSIADAQEVLDRFLAEITSETIAIDGDIARAAVHAFDRYGKGRHPAALNLGDCFAYACAKKLDVAILAKGDDFPHTDLALA